jgi:hypothetical protein
MITFKQYLEEAVVKKWQSKQLSVKKAIELLNANHRAGLQAISDGGLLFRGDKTIPNDSIVVVDSTGSKRTSRDSNSAYQMMMDISTELKDVPSRSESLICTSNYAYARTYSGKGSMLVVVPVDGTTIAVASEEDFLVNTTMFCDNSLFTFSDPLEVVNQGLSMLFISLGADTGKGDKWTDWGKINRLMDSMEVDRLCNIMWTTYLGRRSTPEKLKKFFTAHKKNRLIALASSLMTRDHLSIKTAKFGDGLIDKRECWFSGKAVLISADIFEQILNELNKTGFPIHQRYKKLYGPEP